MLMMPASKTDNCGQPPIGAHVAHLSRAFSVLPGVSRRLAFCCCRTQEWWQENELQRGAGQSSVGQFHIWFHGILSRRAAEMLLQGRPNGTFLVRVSESRYGYSLSFQSGVRCKHYIIDQTLDGRYCVAGKDFFAETLLDLVTHFKTTPLNEEADVLSIPCGQADENNPDFQHLLPQGHTVAAAPRDYSNPSTPAAEAKKKQSFGDLQDYGESDPNAPPPVASGGMGGNSRPQMNLPPPAMRALKPGAQPEGEYGTLPARAPAALPPPVVRSNKPQLAT